MEDDNLICFQDLWSIAVGQSSLNDTKLVEKELLKSVDSLKQGLNYFKEYSESSLLKVKKTSNISETLYKFLEKSSKFLNLDGGQMYNLYIRFSLSYFRGSKEKLQQMLNEDKTLQVLLSELSNYYFIERLYLLRSIAPIIGFFQDKSHPYQAVYSEVLHHLPDIIPTLQKQLEKSFNAKPPTFQSKDILYTTEMITRLSLQRVKEQCEILELIFLYHSQYGMSSQKLLALAKLFKGCGFGTDHPLVEVVDSALLTPLLSCMNALQQVILIEGFDMELLLETDAGEEHSLIKNKQTFDDIDEIMRSIVDQQVLAPVLVSWATIRYLLLDDNGGVITQKLGERAVSHHVWQQVANLVSVYPFNTKSNVASTARRILREVLSTVTRTFHEDTLGDYRDLISIATILLGDSTETGSQGIQNSGLDVLLLSAAGYFPLNLHPLLSLLTSMVKTRTDSIQVHAFVANLPVFAEYVATCGRDEIESLENSSVWRLLASKPIRTAGGLHTIRIPIGTIGHLVESQFGAMVQWQCNVNGWKAFNAEIESLLEYKGPSSNLELLGYYHKSQMIFELVESMLRSMDGGSGDDTGYMAVMETMEMFVEKTHRVLCRVIQTSLPPIKLIEVCVRCLTAWLKTNPSLHFSTVINQLSQIQFFPFHDQLNFDPSQSATSIQLGIYGTVLSECERTNGCFHVTVATIDLLIALLENSLDREESIVVSLSCPIEFLLTEVLSSYQQWQKSDVESWEKIGVRCLEMCHVVLRSSSASVNGESKAHQQLQNLIINVLCSSTVAQVILKLVCINVDTLHASMANEPFSSVVYHLSETIKLGFSLLNNILRMQTYSLSNSDERSYLHEVLVTPSAGNNNFISIVSGYLYHRQNPSLPRISISLLRRISLIAPMSLHSCLGPDVAAIRDVLLTRLKSRTEDISLKVGILELFVVSVQTQPGLLELFLDLEQVDSGNPDKGLTLGKSSCLRAVLDMLEPANQGTYKLPPRLHTACVKLLNALWVDRRHSALQALRSSSKNKGLGFWSSLLFPLFSENSPKDIAQNELLETCSHVINIVALENFYMDRGEKDKTLSKVMKEFLEKGRYLHWSKVFLCVSKSIIPSKSFERRRHQMFASAWRSFMEITSLSHGITESVIDDLTNAIVFLAENLEESADVITVFDFTSSLLLTLVYKQTKPKKKNSTNAIDLHNYLPKVISSLQQICESSKLRKILNNLLAVSIHIIKYTTVKATADKTNDDFLTSVEDLIETTCQLLTAQLRDIDFDTSSITETSLLLVQSLETLFRVDERVTQTWLRMVAHESSVHLVMTALVKNLTSCRDHSANIRLTTAIMRLLINLSSDEITSQMIQSTGLFSQFCLNLTNTYGSNANNKKWIEIYHLGLVLTSHLATSLSYDFLDNMLDFIGVHQDRIVQCLSALRINQTTSLLREANFTTSLLATVSRNFTHQWRFRLRHSYENALKHVLTTCYSCVAMLLHPRLLQKTMKLREKMDTPLKVTFTPTRSLSMRKSISKASDEETLHTGVTPVQQLLTSVLGHCLDFLKNLSPNICQIMFDQGIDLDEYSQLLTISFTTPSMDHEDEASFGSVINAANIALSALHKIDSSDETLSTYHDSLVFVADTALILAISQYLLLIKQSQISHRNKQLLKRELADELNSCVRSASRHLRHSSSSFSPQSSPVQLQLHQTSSNRSPAISMSKGILDLVSAFIKQLIR